jgi:CheY-like chemotaxis protein/HPt (histidine-containing phosphotransfer) domain-containing protein
MKPWVARTPAQALGYIQRGELFDIALIDYQMPDMDGITLLTEIRKMRDAKNLPAVLISSVGHDQTDREIFSAILMKPIRASQLYNTLINILAASGTPFFQRPVTGPLFDPTMATRLPLHILLAEDHATNQKLALLTLGRLGYRADVAANGLEALSALERQPYDVILMDMQMPEMDGLEATRRIRQAWPEDSGPRIIAMTANVTKEDREACMDAGMNDYLAKPIRVDELVAALSKAVPLAAHGASAVDAIRSRTQPRPASSPALTIPAADVSFNPSAIDKLLNLIGGDRAALDELIVSYLNDTTKLLSDLHQALEKNDADLLRRAGHTLKSSSYDFGAMTLAYLGKQLENMGKDKTISNAAGLIAQAEAEYEPVRVVLERIRNGE